MLLNQATKNTKVVKSLNFVPFNKCDIKVLRCVCCLQVETVADIILYLNQFRISEIIQEGQLVSLCISK